MSWRSIIDVLANEGRGWFVVLALLGAELATVLSLLLTIRHTRSLNLDLKDQRQAIISLRNSVGRLSRELRAQQVLYRTKETFVDSEKDVGMSHHSGQSQETDETIPDATVNEEIPDSLGDPTSIDSGGEHDQN